MNLGIAENPSQRRTRGRQTAGIREVSRMPKDGKNRRSGRDEARRNDLGGDEDYDWIKYLGEGRSSSSSSSAAPAQPAPRSPAQPPKRPVSRPALPAPPPQRARPDREAGRGRASEPVGLQEQPTGYDVRQPGQRDARPATGPVTGRAVKVRPGRANDLLFNPHADDYLQPLNPPAGDSQRRASPSPQDWQRQREHEDRPAPRRGERHPDRRLDTAEYVRPLYS